MEKRIFAAVLISIGFLWLWAAVAPKLFPDLMKKPVPAQVETTSTTATTSTQPAPVTASTTTTAPVVETPAAAPTVAVIAATKQTITTIQSPNFVAKFSNRGAELVSFQLTHYKAKPSDKNDQANVELVKEREPNRTDYPFAIEATDANFMHRANAALYAVREFDEKGAHVVEYRWSDGTHAVTKTFRFTDEYLFNFAVSVTPPLPYRVAIGPGIRTLGPDEKDNQFIVTGNGVVQRDDSLKSINREKADTLSIFPSVQYVGIQDNYFLSVLRPEKSAGAIIRAIDVPAAEKKEKRRELYAAINAAPDGNVSGAAFFGPKEAKVVDRYGFEKTLQLGVFGIIARFFLAALVWLNTFTKNYGWAIIVLTLIIKLVLYPLQHKWLIGMKKMQKLQPKQEAIKAKYKKARTDPEQKQKMNMEMMKLYQQEGINPAGGCLPFVLQIPILWGFYGLLSHAIELRGAPFIFWIHDLSMKDPYYITPLLMTVTMFVQQAITPSTADPAQKKMFLIMPLVMGWIFKEFPTGVVLYWLMQNLLTIVQQLLMNKFTDPAAAPAEVLKRT
ncbi:MAG: membrane protein insertase YidC [Acidobacteria bacterium]|nr:membrane protein insertase YidC [Acidobacteriota bacterium]MBV9068612.1 membrane protein insertase YidC [Acidobacteriota bacterium]MBV9185218.1 membrane protein insertase YidC [Acidobacteriota bacterium]